MPARASHTKEAVLSATLLLSAFLSVALAAPPQAEIAHLLAYIEQSGCTFIRNGSEYPAAEARSHMAMKYDYAKDRISRTEQFIEHIASKSSLTGRPYRVRCAGRETRTGEWLTLELKRYRGQTSGAGASDTRHAAD